MDANNEIRLRLRFYKDVNENIDDIRQKFSEVEFQTREDTPFHVTFSAGISSFPEFSAPDILIDAADQAMYNAKAQKRNNVVMARK